MKLNIHFRKGLRLLAIAVMPALLMMGCGSNEGQDPTAQARSEEKDRLQTENQDLAQVRADNEEVKRLKQENQDLPKMRSQYQEAARLKKENDQLKQQIAKIAPAATAAAARAGANTDPQAAQSAQAGQPEKEKEMAQAEGAIHDGDDILVEPKYLKQLLPEFDWEKLDRKEPLSIRALLEKDGLQITNVAQLTEYGITNFVIQRAAPAAQPPSPAER